MDAAQLAAVGAQVEHARDLPGAGGYIELLGAQVEAVEGGLGVARERGEQQGRRQPGKKGNTSESGMHGQNYVRAAARPMVLGNPCLLGADAGKALFIRLMPSRRYAVYLLSPECAGVFFNRYEALYYCACCPAADVASRSANHVFYPRARARQGDR
ncbi:hypothetical protein GCM10022409_40350 [Hymenobacter glaciei]|uniref:Uncharacterized protein n=1 Tax=Hymenobacter glaciei TaxID=877209 RepID=A0ABP7UQ59_9BACT